MGDLGLISDSVGPEGGEEVDSVNLDKNVCEEVCEEVAVIFSRFLRVQGGEEVGSISISK